MTKQPEALRLADELEIKAKALGFSLSPQATELRRLHEENERLKIVPMKYRRMEFNAQLQEENKRLHEVNQELLEALKVLADESNGFSVSGVYFNEKCMGHKGLDMAYAAIAKATGEKP